MNQTTVSSKYQIVIPKEVRRKLQVKPGQKLDVDVAGEQIIFKKASPKKGLNWPQDHLRLLKNPWEGEDQEKYLEKERNSWN